jgi:hypothetical protein
MSDAVTPQMLNALLDDWDQVALFAYDQYCRAGRGVVAVERTVEGGGDDSFRLSYVSFPTAAAEGTATDKVQYLIANYDPDSEILIMYRDLANIVHTQRLRTAPGGRAPKRVWFFEMLRTLNEDATVVPDYAPEWFWNTITRLADNDSRTSVLPTAGSDDTGAPLAPDAEAWTIKTVLERRDPYMPSRTETVFTEIPAGADNVGEWNSRFWELFPSGEAEFVDYARTTGIHAWVALEFEPSFSCFEDRVTWEEEYDDACAKCRTRLPHAPSGYHWHLDSGGVKLGRDARGRTVPLELHFRLWRRDFGYMPTSE